MQEAIKTVDLPVSQLKSPHQNSLDHIFEAQQAAFRRNPFPDLRERLDHLKRLKQALLQNREDIIAAINAMPIMGNKRFISPLLTFEVGCRPHETAGLNPPSGRTLLAWCGVLDADRRHGAGNAAPQESWTCAAIKGGRRNIQYKQSRQKSP